MKRRNFLAGVPASALALSPWQHALAQQRWPNRPIKFVVPFPPGGPTDGIGRLVCSRLQEQLGQPFVVENISGVGGSLGMGRLAKMPADGYAIGLAHTGTHGIGPNLYKNVGYDPKRDFTPIARLVDYVNVLVVNANAPYRSLADLLSAARANPGSINYGSAGNGSSNHLSGEMLAMHAKVGLTHVPYRGSALALNDLLAGTLQFMFDAPNTSLPHLRSGKLRALATTGRTRHRLLPDVPTAAETLPGFEVVSWIGIVGPAGLPDTVQRQLGAELEKTLASPDMAERMAGLGLDAHFGDHNELTKTISTDLALWAGVIKAAGVKVD